MKIQILLTLILVLIGSTIYLQQKEQIPSQNLQSKYNLSQVEDKEIERLHKEFVNWETKFGKKYTDKTEEEYREIVFDIHELEIEEGNKESEEFNLKPNKYTDLTEEEQKIFRTGISDEDEDEEKSFWNYIPYLTDHNLLKAEQKMNEQKLKSSQQGVDYRPYDLGAKDQGYCGTCWAFATNAVLEANFSQKPLSEQFLADCVKEGRKSTGCSYGMSRRGYQQMNFISNVGIGHEEDHPYTMSSNKLNQCQIEETHFQIPSDAEVVAFEDYSTPQCDKLKAMVSEYGPTYISVYSSAINFQYYADGVASHQLDQPWIKKESLCLFGYCLFRDYKVDHAVTLFGYTDDYWIVKNSWGEDWGENGFIRIKMGNYFNICHKGFAIKSDHKKY